MRYTMAFKITLSFGFHTANVIMVHVYTLQRREAEYCEYLKDRLVEAKNEFRALLRETKIITYRSYELVKETDRHHKDIVDVLKVRNMFCSKLLYDHVNYYRTISDTLFWNAYVMREQKYLTPI